MGEINLVQSIGIMIVVSAAIVMLCRRAAIPTIVLFILTGLLLGPFLNILSVAPSEAHGGNADAPGGGALQMAGELGIALLLFLVGLELSLDRIREVGRVAILAGLGQVVFTAVIGFVLCILLQFTVMESVFLASALTFSSTVVVVKLLVQKKELNTLYGRIAVGIFLVQDLVVIVALTFLAGLGKPESMELGAMALSLIRAFLGMGTLLGVALVASKYLLVKPFAWAAQSTETLLIWSLCWCFVFVVAAEVMGLSPEIGAFLAGMSLAQLGCAHDLRRRVQPLMNFFIAIFFVSLGAQMELGDALENWTAAIILSLFVLIGNPFIFMWIIAKSGYGERTSFMTSVTVAQISEFSFIFAAMGVTTGVIGANILSLVTIVGLITIAISAYMILYNHILYDWCRRLGLLRMFRAPQHQEVECTESLRDHIVVVGMNGLGREVARMLYERGETVLAVDTDGRKLAGLRCMTMVGDIDDPSMIEEVSMAHAKLVISALQIEDTNNLLTFRCRQLGVPVAIHAFDRFVIDDLRRLGADFLIDSRAVGSVRLVMQLDDAGLVAP